MSQNLNNLTLQERVKALNEKAKNNLLENKPSFWSQVKELFYANIR